MLDNLDRPLVLAPAALFLLGLLGSSGAAASPPPSDFDGDGKTDIAVFRQDGGHPGLAHWDFLKSSNNVPASIQWGLSTDRPVPADYDGDGITDPAIFRSGSGGNAEWWILGSLAGAWTVTFGYNTDIPVPRDYDGDGAADLAVVRSGTGNLLWFVYDDTIQDDTIQNYCTISWGLSTDKLVPADYDGDGRAEAAVFRPDDGTWYILDHHPDCPPSTPAQPFSYRAIQWGVSTDRPVPGDYDGDGEHDVAVIRQSGSNAAWYILRSSSGPLLGVPFGLITDVPVPGDYDGDGKFDIAVYRPTNGAWYILQSTNGQVREVLFVFSGTPVPSLYIP